MAGLILTIVEWVLPLVVLILALVGLVLASVVVLFALIVFYLAFVAAIWALIVDVGTVDSTLLLPPCSFVPLSCPWWSS